MNTAQQKNNWLLLIKLINPFALIAALLLMVLVMAGTAGATRVDGFDQGGKVFNFRLSGSTEVPGPGDPDGLGMAWISLNPGLKQVCVKLMVTDIATSTAAHIHQAPAGVSGPVVVPLPTPDADGMAIGCIDMEREKIRKFLTGPGEYYINVHNNDYPSGALRGQFND